MMRQGISPIYEQDLEELMKKNYEEGRLHYTTDYKMAYRNAEAIFIGVGTPQMPDGSANLSYIATVARQIAQSIENIFIKNILNIKYIKFEIVLIKVDSFEK